MSLQVICFCKSLSLRRRRTDIFNLIAVSISTEPAVDLSLQLPVHLAQPDALPELHVQQLLAEPRAPLVRVQQAIIVNPGVIRTSEKT